MPSPSRLPTALRASALLVLAACKAKETPLADFVVEVDASPTGVYVADATGPTPLTVPVFATNLIGAAVPSDGLAATSDGPLTSGTPVTDGSGWGSVTLDTGRADAWTITATYGTSSAVGTGYVVAGTPPAWEMPAAVPASATEQLALAGGGFVWANAGAVWWQSYAGGAPVRVLLLPDPVEELTAVQLDQDGVADLLVRSVGHVVLLRGRSAGGLTWERGWASAEGQIVGVSLADLNGDADRDIAIAVVNGDVTDVAWILHDGGEYTFADALEVPYPTWGLSTEDLDGDGDGEVTLLTADGLLRRFGHFDGQWAAAAASEFDLQVGEGARLYPSEDFDADGIEDFLVAGPDLETGLGWQAYLVSTPDRLVYRMFVGSEVDPMPAQLWAAEQDLNGDGVLDVLLNTDTTVKHAVWDPAYDNFDLYTYSGVAGSAPVGGGLVDGDAVADLVVGGSTVRAVGGAVAAGRWSTVRSTGEALDFNVVGAPWFGDLSGDGGLDFVSMATGGAGLILQAYLSVPATEAAAETFDGQGGLSLGDVDPVDLAVCGSTVYALVTDGVETTLWRAQWASNTGLVGPDWGVAVDGVALACTPDGAALVGGSTGSVTRVVDDGSGPSMSADPRIAGGIVDLVAADPDGDGAWTAAACADVGCSIVAADLDGDGFEDLASTGPSGVTVTTVAGTWTRPGAGALSVADVDGDGVLDLVSQDDGLVSVYRTFPAGVTPPTARNVFAPLAGAAGVGDVDGDGLVDLLLPAVDLDPDDGALWDGVLLYVKGT